MSRIVRLAAMVVFVGVLASEPAPVKGDECDCQVTQVVWPNVQAICSDCFAGQVCAETWLCTYQDCIPYEAGAECMFLC